MIGTKVLSVNPQIEDKFTKQIQYLKNQIIEANSHVSIEIIESENNLLEILQAIEKKVSSKSRLSINHGHNLVPI